MTDVISKEQRNKNHKKAMRNLGRKKGTFKKEKLSGVMVHARVSETEKDTLEKEASVAGVTLSAYCRQKLTK